MATDPTTETDLYWEARGSGPAILLIAGTPGDGGQFEALVEELCADHLVITYDRRGTSRSARLPLWSETSVPEQAEDAAACCPELECPPLWYSAPATGRRSPWSSLWAVLSG